MIMEIQLTQAHIDNGIALDCNHCPAALAIKEVVIESMMVDVRGTHIRLWDMWTSETFRRIYAIVTPPAVCEFLVAFDEGSTTKPFSFPLDIPELFLKRVV